MMKAGGGGGRLMKFESLTEVTRRCQEEDLVIESFALSYWGVLVGVNPWCEGMSLLP